MTNFRKCFVWANIYLYVMFSVIGVSEVVNFGTIEVHTDEKVAPKSKGILLLKSQV